MCKEIFATSITRYISFSLLCPLMLVLLLEIILQLHMQCCSLLSIKCACVSLIKTKISTYGNVLENALVNSLMLMVRQMFMSYYAIFIVYDFKNIFNAS